METAEHLEVKQNKLNSLGGLKMLAMLSIFLWHCILRGFFIDLGARACEVLFVISGFLVGYNHFHKNVPATWGGSFRYVMKKIYRFWPLHFFITILVLVFCIRSFSPAELYKCLISLSLLQAWSNNPDIYFACNGVMWYMSALLFCYFMSPLLLKLIKKGIRFSIAVFAAVFLLRFSIDLIKFSYPGLLLTDTHVSPIIRCMEYLMGMLMLPCFMHIKELAGRLQKHSRMFLLTLIELLILGGVLYLLICHTGLWRSVFVLAFCPLVLVLALNEGLVSKLLSIKPLQWFSVIQLEFFIIHQAFIRLFDELSFVGIDSIWIRGSLMFIIIVIAAAAYHVLFTERLAGLMRRVIPCNKQIGKTVQ